MSAAPQLPGTGVPSFDVGDSRTTYAQALMGWEETSWPGAARHIVSELSANRGRLAIIVGDQLAMDAVLTRFERDADMRPMNLGSSLADRAEPPLSSDIEAAVTGATVLCDIEVLFWPDMALRPVDLLRRIASRQPLITAWPGSLDQGRLRFSEPGRPDHFDQPIRDALVLRPRNTAFPDELPFHIERIAP